MNNNNLRKQPINTSNQRQMKFKYSLLTIVLIVCIIELLYSNIQNITKNINHQSKIKALEAKKNEELEKNKFLKSEIENFNSDEILESIVRNNLKMAGKDEILIIINNKENSKQEENSSS